MAAYPCDVEDIVLLRYAIHRLGALEIPLACRMIASLIARRIADVPWAVYASRAYIERHGQPRRLEDIADHSLVEFDGPMKRHAAALWMRSVAPGATIAARGNSVSEVLMAVKSGAGLAPLPMPFAAPEADLSVVVETQSALNFPTAR